MKLFEYWRSSASYRVRIALNLKQLSVEHIPVNLLEKAQLEDPFLQINPGATVPVLEIDDGFYLSQSLAILEYLEEVFPEPSLLPKDPLLRAKVRAFGLQIVADIHPIQNLRVLRYLRKNFQAQQDAVDAWCRHWIMQGFSALEQTVQWREGSFLFGEEPGYAECCLIPQIYNARRFGVAMSQFPILTKIEVACLSRDAFRKAQPDEQEGAPR